MVRYYTSVLVLTVCQSNIAMYVLQSRVIFIPSGKYKQIVVDKLIMMYRLSYKYSMQLLLQLYTQYVGQVHTSSSPMVSYCDRHTTGSSYAATSRRLGKSQRSLLRDTRNEVFLSTSPELLSVLLCIAEPPFSITLYIGIASGEGRERGGRGEGGRDRGREGEKE